MSKINKIITNKPITLTQKEVANLSETLSAVRTAGGGGGATYGGDGRYIEITGNNTITLTTTAANQLDRVIPTKVSDLEDASDYATVESLTAYQAAGDYLSANALNSLSGTWDTVTAKLDKTEFAEVSGNFLTQASLNGYATETYVQTASAGITGWVNDQGYLKTVPNTYYLKTETSGKDELSAAFNDILKYNVTAAAGIEITTATDAGVKTFGISMTAEPVVTDTTLSGYNGIAATRDGEINNQWNIGLTQDITNTINGKLNSFDFTTYTGTTAPNTYLTKTSADTLYQPTGDYVTTADVLTGTSNTLTGIKIGSTNYTIPTTDLSDYYTKTQVDSTFASASQLNSYLTTAQYQTDSASFALKTDISSKNELSTEFAKYTKTEDLNIPTKVSDLTDSADYAKKTDLDGFVTSSNSTITGTKQYALTTVGWTEVSTPTIPDITATNGISADGYKIGLTESVYSAIQEISAANDLVGANGIAVVTGLNNQIIIEPSGISPSKQYAMTITGWAEVQAGTTFTGVTTTGSISGGGVNNDIIGLTTTAENALTAVAEKLDITAAEQTYQTIAGMSNYLTTTDAATTYLPLTGGTVSGQLTISGSTFNNNLYLKRGNNEGFIGLASNGAITIKNVILNSTSQIEFLTSDSKTFDITVKDNSSTPQPVGKLYVMSAHSLADATATSANWANDGMLHIILES